MGWLRFIKENIIEFKELLVGRGKYERVASILVIYFSAITILLHGLLGLYVFQELPELRFFFVDFKTENLFGILWVSLCYIFGLITILATFCFIHIIVHAVALGCTFFMLIDFGCYLFGKDNLGPFVIFGYIIDALSASSHLGLVGFCLFAGLSALFNVTIGFSYFLHYIEN